MRHSPIFTLIMFLTGCAGMELPDQPGPSPASLWADANARYSSEQHDAALFAERCDRDPALFLSNCYVTVQSLNRVDQQAEDVQESGHEALLRRDHQTLFHAITELDGLGRQLEDILQKGNAR